MVWITGIGRTEDGMCVELQALDGSKALTPLEAADANLGLPKLSGRKIRLDLTSLQTGNTMTYLEGLGLGALEASGQHVYEAELGGIKLMIPGQLLVLAILGSKIGLRCVMLKPWSPSRLMTVLANDRTIEVFPTPHRMLRFQVEKQGVAIRIEWMMTYPSAHAAWNSVYRNALDGRFDMTLPRAVVEATVWTRQADDILLVTNLDVHTLTPLEAPFEFAEGLARSEFVFHIERRGPTHGKATPPTSDSRLQAQSALGPMSDATWARVDAWLKARWTKGRGGVSRKHSIRDILDLVVLKLGSGSPWSKISAVEGLADAAQNLMFLLRRAGLWKEVLDELAGS